MKHCLWICFLLAMLVSGCSQEEMLRNGTSVSGEGRTFTTSFENDESRTYLEDGLYSRWTEGDRISLFDASTLNSQYLFAGDTGDSGGTFFRLSKPEGTGNSLAANYAVYPYNKDMTISADGVITLNLPSNQHYAKNSEMRRVKPGFGLTNPYKKVTLLVCIHMETFQKIGINW